MDFQPKNQESSSKNQVYLGDCPARRPHSGIGRVNECYQVNTLLASPAAARPPSPPAARQRIPAALTEAALCAAALATAEPVTAACNPCLRASAARGALRRRYGAAAADRPGRRGAAGDG